MPRPGIRSRAGCFTCRRRKKKCNEEKPTCSGCRRNCLECCWPSEESAHGHVKRSAKRKASTTIAPPSRPSPGGTIEAASATDAAVTLTALRHLTPQGPADEHRNAAITASMSSLRSTILPEHIMSVNPASSALQQAPSIPSSSPSSSREVAPRSTSDEDNRDWDEAGPSFDPNTGAGFTVHADGRASFSPSGSSSGSEVSALPGAAGMESPLAPTQGFDLNLAGMDLGGDGLMPGNMMPDDFDPLGPMETASNASKAGEPATQMAMSLAMPTQISLFPQHDSDASSLLGYYLSRTANSMGNGSTDLNPFVCTFVPLAFSNQLVLQLILAQSAVHRQVGHAPLPSDQIAQRYYTDSLRLFRSAVGEYMSGKFTDKLVLTTGSLILSLTEVARGDIDGNIFDHLIAAKSLLVELFTDSRARVPVDLMDFLVEYYTHMSALSMISVDAQHRSNPLLDVDIEKMARNLMAKKYVGQLCGCWLELLVTIPHVFDLGQRMRGPTPPSPDDITMFGFLQAQIMAFKPEDGVSQDTRLAGLVFQQAVLLYLWSILGWFQPDQGESLHAKLMETAVIDAISLLGQFPAHCRVNTSLCWPLTVIGCCTTDESLQAVLRTRLQTMFTCIGLGNMGETLVLLERVWGLPLERRSPWALCKLMQEHQTWISFA